MESNLLNGFMTRKYAAETYDPGQGYEGMKARPRTIRPYPDQSSGFLDTVKRFALPAAALTAGVGAYALKRGGGTGKSVVRVIRQVPKTEIPAPGSLTEKLHKMMYGADKVVYMPWYKRRTTGAAWAQEWPEYWKTGKEPYLNKYKLKPNEVGIAASEEAHRMIGPNVTGRFDKKLGKFLDDKHHEQELIRKYMPEAHMPTYVGKVKGKAGLKAMHEKMFRKAHPDFVSKDAIKAGEPHYFVKARIDEGSSGWGGHGFVNSYDIDRFLKGKSIDDWKYDQITHMMKNPEKYIMQPRIPMAYSRLAQGNRELRVHTMGDKVIRNSATVRQDNWGDIRKLRAAEDFTQEYLDKLPAKYKTKNIFRSPDIASTPEGKFKFIEMNPGGADSGFLDPHEIMDYPDYVLSAIRSNAAMYKHITGRSTPLMAGLAGTAAAGGTYGAGKLLLNRREDQSS